MILQSLVDYYEALARKGEIARPGWVSSKVSFALEIDENGQLLQIHPLSNEIQTGNKKLTEPRRMELPAPEKRSSGVKANFLCDNAAYLLGLDSKGKPERAAQCFEAAKTLHTSLLNPLEDAFAKAICRYFESWDVCTACENPEIIKFKDDLETGANIVFMFAGKYPSENISIARAWQECFDDETKSTETLLCCLVTGEKVVPALIHPSIKGVQGAQSSGAALVSFNAPAFCSYEREQNLNAPVGKYASFAYTSALNYLLSDKKHTKRFDDTTLVYWAEDAEPRYQDAMLQMIGGSDENTMTDGDLDAFMKAIVKGEHANWEDIPLDPENRFYVLGLAPNAARLSVRFFLRDDFGSFVKNIMRHYEDIEIVSDGRSKWQNIPLWALLRETVNEKASDKSASPQMAGDTLRAILTGGKYPATFYQQAQLRIKAERNITRGRAAIIKAYLIRNTDKNEYREATKVELNESTVYQPYLLGRLFSVAEAIQEKASGVTSIKDKYFSSACATPAVVFPMVLNLAEKHLKKLDGGIRVYYAKQLGELLAQINASYPPHHNLFDQGIFQLGYYHQTQKRYEKKDKTDNTLNTEEIEEEK